MIVLVDLSADAIAATYGVKAEALSLEDSQALPFTFTLPRLVLPPRFALFIFILSFLVFLALPFLSQKLFGFALSDAMHKDNRSRYRVLFCLVFSRLALSFHSLV